MRKISKTRASRIEPIAHDDVDVLDPRPLGLAGATITSWPGSLDIDFDTLFARGQTGTTVSGAASGKPVSTTQPARGTVALSDGTRITFATAGQFEIVESV